MIAKRKELAEEALDKALEIREEVNIPFNVPLCIYGLCDQLGVRVRFVDISMEGLYLASKSPLIKLSSLRPIGRRVFNCGHELGHHVFGHGSTLDELQEGQSTSNSNPEEFIVNAFSGFLLMPPNAVRRAFGDRGWKWVNATPDQLFRIACMFGVGYETLVTHLGYSLNLIKPAQVETYLKFKLATIRRSLVGDDSTDRLLVIDDRHLLPTADTEVGTHILLPSGSETDRTNLEFVSDLPGGRLFKAVHPGLVRVEANCGTWAIVIRVSRYQYVGLSQYRHLEETENE